MAKITHSKKHDIDSTANHVGVGAAVENDLISFDANGLPKDSGKLATYVVKNSTSSSAPTVDFDSTAGYSVGSEHTQTGADGAIIWKCTDSNVGAAIWKIFVGEGADTTDVSEHGKVDVVAGINISQPVYISGQSGATKAKYKLGDRTGHDSSHLTGLARESKTNSQDIEVIRIGRIVGTTADPLNTTTFSDNPPERLHLSTSGTIVGDSPGGGGSHIEIGRCIRSHATEGVIQVDIAKYVHSIRAWSGGEIELAIGSDDNTTCISIQLFDGTEFAKITVDGFYIDDIKEYTTDAGVTIDGVLLKDGDITAVNIQYEKNTGVVSWGGSSDYYDAAYLVSDDKFKITRPGMGLILSDRITWAADQETSVLSANNTHWIYFNSSGIIQSTTTRTDVLFENNLVVFEVFYDGATYIVVKEDHPLCIPVCVSNELHSAHNMVFDSTSSGGEIERVATGGGGSADDRRIKVVGAIILHDHGLETTVPDSGGSGVSVNHLYTNGSVQWIVDSTDSEFPMKWNSSGTPTTLGNGKYGVFRVTTSKDDKNSSSPVYISIMHTEEFNSIVAARNAIAVNGGAANATGELAALEVAQIGFVIVQNNVSGGIIAEATPAKKVVVGEITGQQNLASLVQTDTTPFDNILSTEANVQAALETLDDHTINGHSDVSVTNGQLLIGKTDTTFAYANLTAGEGIDVTNADGAITILGEDASPTNKGIVELSTPTEIDTGTDNVRGNTPYGLANSKYAGGTKGTIHFWIDGGGSVITSGEKLVKLKMPYAGTITSNTLLADQVGSVVVDIWKDTYANFPPTVADTIVASAKPTLSSVNKSQDSTLIGWTKTFVKDDILVFNIDSVSTILYLDLYIDYDITGV